MMSQKAAKIWPLCGAGGKKSPCGVDMLPKDEKNQDFPRFKEEDAI
jgi:hypothetical protein